MLGRIRRTSRTDVGLVLSFAGIAYLVWVLCTGTARQELGVLAAAGGADSSCPLLHQALRLTFGYQAAGIDAVGLVWLAGSLFLVMGSSRQKWSVSWPWMCAAAQGMGGAMVACWAAAVAGGPLAAKAGQTARPDGGWTVFSLAIVIALLAWVTVLVVLLYERAHFRGPSLRDGQRTHVGR